MQKVKDELFQTAAITDQNGEQTLGKTNCGNKELALLARAIKEGRTSGRRRLVVSFKQPKTLLNLV